MDPKWSSSRWRSSDPSVITVHTIRRPKRRWITSPRSCPSFPNWGHSLMRALIGSNSWIGSSRCQIIWGHYSTPLHTSSSRIQSWPQLRNEKVTQHQVNIHASSNQLFWYLISGHYSIQLVNPSQWTHSNVNPMEERSSLVINPQL